MSACVSEEASVLLLAQAMSREAVLRHALSSEAVQGPASQLVDAEWLAYAREVLSCSEELAEVLCAGIRTLATGSVT